MRWGTPRRQRLALGGHALGDLGAGLREPLGDGVGVREQQRADLGRRGAAGAAVQQADAELALERGDLLGDRRLRQRERLGRAGERPAVRDLAKGEQAARVDHGHRMHSVQLMDAEEVI